VSEGTAAPFVTATLGGGERSASPLRKQLGGPQSWFGEEISLVCTGSLVAIPTKQIRQHEITCNRVTCRGSKLYQQNRVDGVYRAMLHSCA
jgi:hypothetical protein